MNRRTLFARLATVAVGTAVATIPAVADAEYAVHDSMQGDAIAANGRLIIRGSDVMIQGCHFDGVTEIEVAPGVENVLITDCFINMAARLSGEEG